MSNIALEAQAREVTGRSVASLRDEMIVPAVIYGEGIENKNVQLSRNALRKAFDSAGHSQLIDLKLEGGNPVQVLIQDVQFHPVKDEITHVDFYQIREDKTLRTEIPITIVGITPAIKTHGALLNTSLDEVEIECLPKDLISEIKVDVSVLEEMTDSIHVKDLEIPDTIKILTAGEIMIAGLIMPREEKEEEVVAPVEGEEGEEGVEGEEGAAPAEGAAPTEGEAKPEGETKPRGEAPKEGGGEAKSK